MTIKEYRRKNNEGTKVHNRRRYMHVDNVHNLYTYGGRDAFRKTQNAFRKTQKARDNY